MPQIDLTITIYLELGELQEKPIWFFKNWSICSLSYYDILISYSLLGFSCSMRVQRLTGE